MRTGLRVCASSRSELFSPLVTRSERPWSVGPTRRPPAITCDRRSSWPSGILRATITSSGGPPAQETASPVKNVRPAAVNATSGIRALLSRRAVRARWVRAIEEEELGALAVGVADGERAAVRAEGDATHGAHDRAAVADRAGAGEPQPHRCERARVEERHAAVVASRRQEAPGRAERVIDDPLPGATEHGERRGAA